MILPIGPRPEDRARLGTEKTREEKPPVAYTTPDETSDIVVNDQRQAARLRLARIVPADLLGHRSPYSPKAALDAVVIVIAAYDECGGATIERVRDHVRGLLKLKGVDCLQASAHGISRACAAGMVTACGIGQPGVVYRLRRCEATQSLIDAATARILDDAEMVEVAA